MTILDSTCEVLPQGTFCNINPNLPSDVRVGYHHTDDEPIFCLDADDDKTTCYKDMPEVHRMLSGFNINDYHPDASRGTNVAWSNRKLNDDVVDAEEENITTLSFDDIDNLVPGMWLNCRVDENDDEYYEAMYLTADISRMSPTIVGTPTKQNSSGHIGVEYYEVDDDDDDEEQKWIPISWCKPHDDEYNIWPCDISQDSTVDSMCEYMVEQESIEALFHRAFKDLSAISKKKQSQSNISDEKKKVLFTYSPEGGHVVENDDGYLEMGGDGVTLPAEMDTSSYNTIYSALPFQHPFVNELDDKYRLYLLYKDDPLASKVFPKSYSSYKEALLDTPEGEEDGSIFYIKESGATRGEGIYIKTWDELGKEYQELDNEGEYDVDEGENDIIIQKAVTDLYTIDGDGPIAKRRFDIRFYLLIAHGKVWLHSNLTFKWVLGPEYDPNDTSIENQVGKSYTTKHDMVFRLFVEDPYPDENGNGWNNNEKKRRRNPGYSGTGTNINHNKFDPHGWRDAVANALDDVSSVFTNLKKLTKADPTKYVFAGGDAMIKKDGSAVLVEFNVFPDIAGPMSRLESCLAGGGCRRMLIHMDSETDDTADNYIVTEPSPAMSIVSGEGTAEVMRDTVSMVMQLQPAHEIVGFREIVTRG